MLTYIQSAGAAPEVNLRITQARRSIHYHVLNLNHNTLRNGVFCN